MQLTAVNDKMAGYTNTPGASSHNAALMHTLQRHRDILQVYTSLSRTTFSRWKVFQLPMLVILSIFHMFKKKHLWNCNTFWLLFYPIGLYSWIPQNQKQLLQSARARGPTRLCSQRHWVSAFIHLLLAILLTNVMQPFYVFFHSPRHCMPYYWRTPLFAMANILIHCNSHSEWIGMQQPMQSLNSCHPCFSLYYFLHFHLSFPSLPSFLLFSFSSFLSPSCSVDICYVILNQEEAEISRLLLNSPTLW